MARDRSAELTRICSHTVPAPHRVYKSILRSLRELAITETELNAIAAAARMGLSKRPNIGYKTPAATGTPATL